MITSPDQLGSVPQPGVNPQAHEASQPGNFSPDDLDYFRNDPEIIAAVTKFLGRDVDMAKIPDDMLITLAGMVQKLGVDGAIAEVKRLIPPDQFQKLRIGPRETLRPRGIGQ